MFSSFGVSAITGSVLVALLQYDIGYTGMLYLCLAFTLVSFFLTFIYEAEKKFKYTKLFPKSHNLPISPSIFVPADTEQMRRNQERQRFLANHVRPAPPA